MELKELLYTTQEKYAAIFHIKAHANASFIKKAKSPPLLI